MKNITKIAILGGGGRTGKFLVSQLIAEGYNVKLLLRNPENFTIEGPSVEIIRGDALDAEAIHRLLKDCQAVISTVGQRKDEPLVSSAATTHVLNSMKFYGIKRYILVAGLNVDTPFDNKSEKTQMATDWMAANFPEPHADRQKTYTILASSDLDWTQLRVPLIVFTEIRAQIITSLEDCKGDKINAADIAAFIIEQLNDSSYFRQSPFIANT